MAGANLMNKLIPISIPIILFLFFLFSSSSSFAMLGEQGSDKMMEEYQNMTKYGKSDSLLKNLWDGFSFFISSALKVFSDCQKNKAVKTGEALYGSSKPEDMQQIFNDIITVKDKKVNLDAKGVTIATAEVNFSTGEADDTNADKINDFEKRKAIYRNYIESLKNNN